MDPGLCERLRCLSLRLLPISAGLFDLLALPPRCGQRPGFTPLLTFTLMKRGCFRAHRIKPLRNWKENFEITWKYRSVA